MSDLAPRRKGRKMPKRLAPEIEAIITSVIHEHYLSKQKKTGEEVIAEVHRRCRIAKLDNKPCAGSIRARLRAIHSREKALRREGKKAAHDKFGAVEGSFPGADVPLAVIQIDHTPLPSPPASGNTQPPGSTSDRRKEGEQVNTPWATTPSKRIWTEYLTMIRWITPRGGCGLSAPSRFIFVEGKMTAKTPVVKLNEKLSPDTIGNPSAKFPVEIGTRFLEHFSEQLYSSPQKAFEELISNGWDAGADYVDVRIADDLTKAGATMCVLDNGTSMDAEGLRSLWHIAFSPKKDNPEQFGRRVIGKFGIGKLATYVLANKLTYICKSEDGIIRRVTMDYADIDKNKGDAGAGEKLVSEMELSLYEAQEKEVAAALSSIDYGGEILAQITEGVPCPAEAELGENEFGGNKSAFAKPTKGTWTLVVLSYLKPVGRDLKIGVLRRMLEAALPFGSEMAIRLNGEFLKSSKSDATTMAEWEIGPELGIDSVELPKLKPKEVPSDGEEILAPSEESEVEKILIKSGNAPFPYIELPGVGRVTGRVRLFVDRISGGKSDERGASNGFHINVLGRVVNQHDTSFGEENLSHAAWARFRMTVRADGLNEFLTTSREQFKERRELKIFRAFLRKVFNKARTYYDSDQNVGIPDGGDLLVRSLGVLSLSPLRNVVSETLRAQPPILGLFDEAGITDREEKRKSWRENTSDNIRNALSQVKYERQDDESFVKFRISDNTIVINKEHPFVLEYSRTRAEKELMRTMAMVSLLTDVYAIDIGIPPTLLENIRGYRDQLLRFKALTSRQSGTHIAKLLLQTQHDSSGNNSKKLEAVLSDALRYLGFHVKDLAKPGEPEGIASAYAIPTNSNPTKDNRKPPLYSVAFDAKSSKHETSKTGNIDLAAVVAHRKKYGATYSLVVAPGFTGEAIDERCAQQEVTPLTARDLGKLLEYTVEYGAIPLTKIREVFSLFTSQEVSEWVGELERWMKDRRPLTIDTFLKALENLDGKVPDVLPAGMIAYECRQNLDAIGVKDEDVIAVAKGLSILVPDLVGITDDKIVVNASPSRVAAAVEKQLDNLHSDDSSNKGDRP